MLSLICTCQYAFPKEAHDKKLDIPAIFIGSTQFAATTELSAATRFKLTARIYAGEI